MDPPVAAEVETKSEKSELAKSYDCGLCDTEIVYKIAQELLPGLASSCVDSTTGGLFTSAGSVAVDMRKAMTDYLTQRSETYVAEFLLSENASMLEISEHPYDIIISLIDDFTSTKRNMFSRVSEWVLSDRRDDRIDDFVQETEINGFWLLARREYVASVLLKNVDYKNSFHCNMVCSSEEELVKHRAECMLRPMDCTNEGCSTRYCAAQKENHEAICPFMVLPCEQKCSDFVMRREMDRHCVTICPMKLMNCAFYTVGCNSSIPRCNVQQHNADELSSHLLYIIRTAHKEASEEVLKHRVEQIKKLSNTEKLARARDTRALTYLIKDAEAKFGPLDINSKLPEDSNKNESPTKTEPSVVKDGVASPKKKEDNKVQSTEKPVITEDNNTKLATKTEPSVVKDGAESQGSQSTEKPVVTEDENIKLPAKEVNSESSTSVDPPVKTEGNKDKDESSSSPKVEKVKDESSNTVSEKTEQIFDEDKIKQSASSDEEDAKKSPRKETVKESSRGDEDESKKSTTNEMVKDSSEQREKMRDSYESDDEESMKSTLETDDDR
ncbi:uncharacterized protein LOC143617843 [Bidens hawaiensis]|uniref:uncharacterized protein LOC143617843 n=1 Tax=Bidens hawaiensis TaxID=980011 RepID=UPI00404A5F03